MNADKSESLSAFICVTKVCLCLCPYRRREPVGFAPDGRASEALPVFALVAEAAHVVAPLVVAAVERVAPVAVEQVALVDFAPELIHDAFVVVAAAAEQLRAVVAVVEVALVRRLFRPAAVVAQVEQPVQLAAHLAHVPLVAVRSAVVVAPARRDVVHVVYPLIHAAVELVALAVEEQRVVAPLAVHRVPGARLSP